MPYVIYKLIHFLGIFTMVVALAAMAMHALQGGRIQPGRGRRWLGITHGVAAFLVLLGGFGMLARLGIAHDGLPAWVYLKLLIWLGLGVAVALPYRGKALARALLVALPLLAVAGGAVALYKPF
jgi:hypothetical protein